MNHRRKGFILLTVLWSIMLAAVLAATGRAGSAVAITAAHNRISIERGQWTAQACLAQTHQVLDMHFANETDEVRRTALWQRIDEAIEGPTIETRCDIHAFARGAKLNVNRASVEQMRALLQAADARTDGWALAAALLDWRDSDHDPEPDGAEAEWYRQEGLSLPRNGPFRSVEEISLVRGFGDRLHLLRYLSTTDGLISLSNAPLPVLAAIPGVSPLMAGHVLAVRSVRPLGDLRDVLRGAPAESSIELLNHFEEAARVTTVTPDAWYLSVRIRLGDPVVERTLRATLVRTARHLHVASIEQW